ncbi:hypothetical protein [Streptomyces sp. GESEQ-35]|uniref:hypothetical protein n=1 Tax=Streptomyces sp. GESEQ-35 TaxID=2812657 RepID=UPI001B327C8D|nr:hypothetical protein [Streptomyces sp. GESEQ-35]
MTVRSGRRHGGEQRLLGGLVQTLWKIWRPVNPAFLPSDGAAQRAALGLQAMECRDDLLETAVVVDALALCRPPGGRLPLPYQEEPGGPDEADELRTDASSVASHLAEHDLRHGTSRTGDIPPPLREGCTESERDAVREYARREWRAREDPKQR